MADAKNAPPDVSRNGAKGNGTVKNVVKADSVGNLKLPIRTSDKRTARRCHLARHLHAAGPRPVLEALLELEGGRVLDDVLESFGRVMVADYHAVGASA